MTESNREHSTVYDDKCSRLHKRSFAACARLLLLYGCCAVSAGFRVDTYNSNTACNMQYDIVLKVRILALTNEAVYENQRRFVIKIRRIRTAASVILSWSYHCYHCYCQQ